MALHQALLTQRSYHNFSVKARLGAKQFNNVELGNSLLFLQNFVIEDMATIHLGHQDYE